MKPYKYYVSFVNYHKNGFGNTVFSSDSAQLDEFDILKIKDYIEREFELEHANILNIMPLPIKGVCCCPRNSCKSQDEVEGEDVVEVCSFDEEDLAQWK